MYKRAKNLYVTEIGEVVNNIMKQSFPSIVDVNFTANMEGLLDMVEEGKVQWKTVIRNFYPDLDEAVEKAEKELEKVKIEDEVTDVICDDCGRNMVIKYGPHGKFLACPGFPECRNTNHILKRSVLHVRYVERMLYSENERKAENITDVRIIRNVILCHGRSHQQRNVRNVVAIWWKKEINLSAVMNSADM